MNSPFRYRERAPRGRRSLVIVTLFVILLVAVDFVSQGTIRGFARMVGGSIWSVGTGASDAILGSGFFSSKAALARENAALREELAQANTRAALYLVEQEENRALHDLVHLAQATPGVTAPITSSLRSSPYGTFTIGAGASDGITPGHFVMTSDSSKGFVVGEVSEVSEHSSLVTQLFAPNVVNEGSVRGVDITLEGRGGGNARAEVPRSAGVAVGDPITAPKYGGRALGIVGDVKAESSSAYSEVFINVPVNVGNLSFVYVISAGH